MKSNLPQPYWSHVLNRFPKDMNLLEAAAGYLEMRIGKNPDLSINEWDACLDELIAAYDIEKPDSKSKVRRISTKKSISVPEIVYLFLTATARKWNHLVFTAEQDRMYANISYYQDPYWHEIKNNTDTLKILREELKQDG